MKVCIVESEAKMVVSFHLFSTGVYLCLHCSHPHPCEHKVEAVACWFTASLTGRVEKGDSLVYLAMVVLISLVNRIFHKRSDGLEQFLFYARKGMCLFHPLKGDFCVVRLQQPNSFLSASALCFCVFSVNAFGPRGDLILSFFCLCLTLVLSSIC